MLSPILTPLVALVLWSFVMWGWLYATRIPAITRLKIRYDPNHPNAEFHAQIPPQVRWKADNYNNLMEQPTLFYAIVLVLALAGAGEGLNLVLAWAYVSLRVIHSLIQATVNAIMPRFTIFMLGSIVLLVLTIRAALLVI
jgi:hypothetical protein